MAAVKTVLAGLLVCAAAVLSTASPHQASTSDRACRTIKPLTERSFTDKDGVAEQVLKELCQAGQHHVLQEGKKHRYDRVSTKSATQFAVLNLHSDATIKEVHWDAGDATNVMKVSDWWVDEEEAVPTGQGTSGNATRTKYTWYRHGLPMWPLLNQTLNKPMSHVSPSSFSRFIQPMWPNYALATPLYLIPYETKNLRDPMISMNKVFSKLEDNKQMTFVKPYKFLKYIRRFYQKAHDSIEIHPENTSNWLTPLVHLSLPYMLRSFKARHRPRGSRCPDQLYVFLLKEPYQHDFLQKLDGLLRTAKCVNSTRVVAGYSEPASKHTQ